MHSIDSNFSIVHFPIAYNINVPQQQPPQSFIWNFKVGDRCVAKYWEGKTYTIKITRARFIIVCHLNHTLALIRQMKSIIMPRFRRSPIKRASSISSNTATLKRCYTPIACQSPTTLCQPSTISIQTTMHRVHHNPIQP